MSNGVAIGFFRGIGIQRLTNDYQYDILMVVIRQPIKVLLHNVYEEGVPGMVMGWTVEGSRKRRRRQKIW